VENALKLENRHTGEILHLRRVRDADGQTVQIDGSLSPRGGSAPASISSLRKES
jgi:hypothetical protein